MENIVCSTMPTVRDSLQLSNGLSLFSILAHFKYFVWHCVLEVNFEYYISSTQEAFFPYLIQ